ncbi:MAG: cell division ATP-binding protein FtsE [Candidatus Magasanikbacteria bacterium CG1_02_41_34]|uniref:Cell division ATP-binding protein FtsE n=1 Tax=Candidatus Magasanikbacteria bacterium CG_4_10_14_0_2_um_filter_41_31 TaxID=1974639 RepID=A0A2M7V5N9_9BACT|nr:MAG: cell division ATP-binding protein FtsE [Candidatus Magasanikbacteria bacterium CG1_02_41_34]PIZ93943.1 MAG: cell division ATP-binding protein FtsE [Candidatus Magasanikbacteria bacterium CG_4_10_14_0_2_um_filter_41_31]
MSMIHLTSVSKQYTADSVGLADVDLSIEAGEFVSIVGQSGTGKTTLIKLLIAEEKPTSGQIEIGGWDISRIRQSDVPLLRRQIGVIFQDFKLLPKKTVRENVAFALQVAGEPHKRIKDIVPRVLEIVGLGPKMERYPHQLSGGEQQRVVIARSLVHRPKIIVADEPTGNLDSINTQEIMEILKKINEFGTTIVLVTHNRDIVNQLRKRVVVLQDGKIISDEQHGKYHLSATAV